jgi:hypothetical protein
MQSVSRRRNRNELRRNVCAASWQKMKKDIGTCMKDVL